jgi:TRAP-type mannitol/chloroaromatic compound transport system permease small subunit
MPLIRFISRLSLWAGYLAAIVVLPLIAAMVYEVISRYAFARPTAWAFELSYMMMGTIFLLGTAYALLIGQHVNVDFIHARLPARGVAAIDFIGYVILTAMSAWLTFALFNYAVGAYRSGEGSGLSAWNPPIWPYRLVFVVGFGLFTLQALAKAIENAMRIVSREPQDRPS